jgi:hypothetical protein
MWPGFTFRYRQRVNRFDPGDYILEREPAEVPADALVVSGSQSEQTGVSRPAAPHGFPAV